MGQDSRSAVGGTHRPVRDTSTDYQHPYRPLPVAWANHTPGWLARRGWPWAPLDRDGLVVAARRRTGLWDLGRPYFQEPLDRLLASLEQQARLHPLGRLMVRENLIRILANRLRATELLRRHPEAGSQLGRAPVFIVGLQRTGTTLLHRLLSLDPRFRTLYSWEAINPAPARSWLNPGPDPRLQRARTAQRALRYLAPDFFAVHPVEAQAPEEDCLLFDYSFLSTVFEATLRVPGYSAWLEQQDPEPAYRAYSRMLALLWWQRPAQRWLLKTPHHLEHLPTLLRLFPDAQVIQTHRKPVQALASFCSMVAHGQGVFSDEVDVAEVGRHWSAKTALMVRRAMEARAQGQAHRFIDVDYRQLVRHPLEQVQQVYEFLGEPLPTGCRERMRRWLGQNPQHKYGRHRYRLEDFGLQRAREEKKFGPYCAAFLPGAR